MKRTYSDELINTLVRTALTYEKKKKFEEAIEIYEELAIQNVEFAIDRIPLVKHRYDNYKLRRLNFNLELVSSLALAISIILISYNIALSIFKPLNLNYSFSLTASEAQEKADPDTTNVIFKNLDSTYEISDSEYDIVVKNTTRKNLTKRVQEVIEAYKYNTVKTEDLKINILKPSGNNTTTVGYINYNPNKPEQCTVFIKAKLV